MTEKPRQRLSEFVTEVRLTGSKYVVVEGPNDRRFLVQWFESQEDFRSQRPPVISVDSLDIDAGELLALGLNEGSRSRVIFVAMRAEQENLDLRCIADLDCGHDVDLFTGSTLIWTDFPAIESYGFNAKTLDSLNRLFLGERLPAGDVLLGTMSPMLADLFTVRTNNPHLPDPDIPKGLTKERGVFKFDVALTLVPTVAAKVPSYGAIAPSDPRSSAYGHDICAMLFALHSNVLKNQAHVADPEALEHLLRAAILIANDLRENALFSTLIDWAA